jgi:hypothetical protein
MAKRAGSKTGGTKKKKTAGKAEKKQSKEAAKKTAKNVGKKAAKKKKIAKKASPKITGAALSGVMIPASFKIDNAGSEDEMLGGAFEKIIARGNQHNKSPVCYSELSDGQWEVCLLQKDGSYGQCKRYYGPVHTPVCGG